MMVSTQLGRRVQHNDWYGFHRDRLLLTLYQMRETSGNEARLSLQEISGLTGLDNQMTGSMIRGLRDLEMIFIDSGSLLYGIEDRGVKWVEESPTPPKFG